MTLLEKYKINIISLIYRLVEKEKHFILWKHRDTSHTGIAYTFENGKWYCHYYAKSFLFKRSIEQLHFALNEDEDTADQAIRYVSFNYILLSHEELGPDNIIDRLRALKDAKKFYENNFIKKKEKINAQ